MKKPLTIRLSPEARDALERLAQRESRSLASYLEWTIRQKAQESGCWIAHRTAVKAVAD